MELFVWVVTVLSVKSRDISYSICQGPPPSPCGLAFGHHLGLARLGILWPMQLQILGQKQRTTYPVDHGPTRRRLPSFRTGLACSRPVLPSVLPFANSLSNGCASFPPSRVFFLGKKTHEALVFVPPFSPSLPTVDRLERRHRVDLLPPRIVVAASRRSAGVKGGARQA
uniref:Uncharacterized protein n=1 Tax=Triticum urartu TaxID=4572 RepID=A0A8R7JZD9_TRIUA